MAQLIIEDIDDDVLASLERRAEQLGTTIQREASRLLRITLQNEAASHGSAPSPLGGASSASVDSDPRFVWRHGFLIFGADIPPNDVPDHRTLREERIASILDEER